MRAFEAAARHLHFANAAEELHLDPTAVSHQVRKLESFLGIALFQRSPRPIRLTPAGEKLYPVLRDALDSVADAIVQISPGQRSPLTVSMTLAFANEWFTPRLPSIREATGLDLIVKADNAPVDVERGVTDLAIRSQETPGSYGRWNLFRQDALIAVAAPTLAKSFKTIPAATKDIAKAPLIHFEWASPDRVNLDWKRWFDLAKIKRPIRPFVASFSEESHAIQAAIAGVGVALLSETLVDLRIARGELIRVSELQIPAPSFWLVMPEPRGESLEVARLIEQLSKELVN
ncbi:LysR family transcriptional regulator [Pacificimonas pallii]|uniref:LysR family transcriptional regulator n=1 Tax=Pacificimonas pallii TaxID=2827236 RepID=UPI002102FC51|nr:LysR family transcriptional regulator [Pacificimonas pallii]